MDLDTYLNIGLPSGCFATYNVPLGSEFEVIPSSLLTKERKFDFGKGKQTPAKR